MGNLRDFTRHTIPTESKSTLVSGGPHSPGPPHRRDSLASHCGQQMKGRKDGSPKAVDNSPPALGHPHPQPSVFWISQENLGSGTERPGTAFEASKLLASMTMISTYLIHDEN